MLGADVFVVEPLCLFTCQLYDLSGTISEAFVHWWGSRLGRGFNDGHKLRQRKLFSCCTFSNCRSTQAIVPDGVGKCAATPSISKAARPRAMGLASIK